MTKLASNKNKNTNLVPDFKTRNLLYLPGIDYDVYRKTSNLEGTQDTINVWESRMQALFL